MSSKSLSIIVISIIIVFPAIALGQACGWTDDESVVYVTDPDDNVGIGTPFPQTTKLKIAGNIEATGFRTKMEIGATYPSVYGGLYNGCVGSLNAVTIAGGYSNLATGYSFIGGGTINLLYSLYSIIVGGKYNLINEGPYSVIGGGYLNEMYTISDYSVIAGGRSNKMTRNIGDSCRDCVIGGGKSNYTSGTTPRSTIAGGGYNIVQSYDGTVCGGYYNISGYHSFVGGGVVNYAIGAASVVPGGYNNQAYGEISFAAGYGAKTNTIDNGSFVWSDGHSVCQSTDSRQFMVCAGNGAYFTDNVSALSFDDRPGDYPDLEKAYNTIQSIQSPPDGGYIPNSDSRQRDNTKSNSATRNLSDLVSAQNKVIMNLVTRIAELDKQCNNVIDK